ncbi:MAG: ATP-binding cassette domain-containing protein [Lachnospiraceae bacterium]|nr:ATP-binding cassette domain-containing protein [Lachnospiraceae bacterium]
MDLDKTTNIMHGQRMPGVMPGTAGTIGAGDLIVTVFDGGNPPVNIRLADYRKNIISFGRGPGNDIVLTSPLVSSEHGRFAFENGQWTMEDRAYYGSSPSTNGLIYNNASIVRRALCEGDFIRIDDGVETIAEGVLFVFAAAESAHPWKTVPLRGQKELTIGREQGCSIILPHISVSKQHAKITSDGSHYYITDNGSTNGVVVNNRRLRGRQVLHEKDVITITNSKLIFTSSMISYCCYGGGISVDAENVVITRGKGKKAFVTGNNVSLNIKPGELIAIIGGSGAGKSTIMNAMSGYLPPASGKVYINGIDLYENFDSLKKLIGYVPQSDIVYDNLTLHDMLLYTSKLRLPPDTSDKEREAAIDRAISLVELPEKKNSFIKSLSGGQRKRASIAVELLSDPNLLFLDEPSSGLDPGTERNLMHSLREMADGGKTVILVTHSTLQLRMCDKIVFMGKGGNLCFFGAYDDALAFFNVPDVVDVYSMITDHAPEWKNRYDASVASAQRSKQRTEKKAVPEKTRREKKARQLPVLCARYMKLVFNDRQRLILLLLQAPLLAVLISFVANGKQYEQYEMTQSLLFSLSCCAFWIGMLNAIQEICKERTILKREYMTGLSLTNYILSKVIVLGIMCVIQSAMIVGVFTVTVGLPEEGVMTIPFLEIFITTFFTAISAAGMGLFVSCLFTNADRAMTVAPILLMPQILFSGMMFKLSGATKVLSWFTTCRWSMEAYGTTANLNELPLSIQVSELGQQLEKMGMGIQHKAEECFEFTAEHIFFDWGILVLSVIIYLVIARIVLSSVGKENG